MEECLDMHHRKKGILTVVAVLFILGFPVTASHATPVQETKVRLQSDLQRHIYRSLVDGAFHTLNSETGDVRALYPLTSHPLILKMGEHYIMCADFRDSQGNEVDVDFYLIRKPKGFQVFQAEIDNHELVLSLIRSGKAKIL